MYKLEHQWLICASHGDESMISEKRFGYDLASSLMKIDKNAVKSLLVVKVGHGYHPTVDTNCNFTEFWHHQAFFDCLGDIDYI